MPCAPVSAFLSPIGLTYLVRLIALKKNIIDNPNERSSHTIPTPRGGGLAIVLVWFVGLTYLFLKGQLDQSLFFALLSGLVLALVSLLDDILGLKPTVRLVAQAVSAFGALWILGGINLFPSINSQSLFWLMNFGAFIGVIWFINLFNFLDGIDAYASQEAILVASGLLVLTGNPLLGLLIAAVGGFLVWNWPKAKIFMGDVGSTQLGFILVVFGIYYHNTQEINIANWLILTSCPLLPLPGCTIWRKTCHVAGGCR
jgi:Fuc2NAc and GlcNAc transferase